jgi:hypothetical protein
MRRFFLALRVRVEDVTRPLPDVVQPVQCPAEGVLRQPPAGTDFQDLLEQGHRPAGVRVAPVLRRGPQQGLQQVLVVLVQQRGTAAPLRVPEGGGVEGLGVEADPLVDGLPRDAEHAGDVRGGASGVELQDGQGTPIDTGIPGLGELAAEPLALPGCQVEPAHVLASGQRRDS